jgi:hypothetical protein
MYAKSCFMSFCLHSAAGTCEERSDEESLFFAFESNLKPGLLATLEVT